MARFSWRVSEALGLEALRVRALPTRARMLARARLVMRARAFGQECSGAATCSAYRQAAATHGEGTEAFLRAMLAEGHFHARSRFAYLNELTPAVPADALLPWGAQKRFLCAALRLEPPRKRRRGNGCTSEDCALRGFGCQGGRACLRLREARAAAAAPRSSRRGLGTSGAFVQTHCLPTLLRAAGSKEQQERGLRGR